LRKLEKQIIYVENSKPLKVFNRNILKEKSYHTKSKFQIFIKFHLNNCFNKMKDTNAKFEGLQKQ